MSNILTLEPQIQEPITDKIKLPPTDSGEYCYICEMTGTLSPKVGDCDNKQCEKPYCKKHKREINRNPEPECFCSICGFKYEQGIL